MILGLGSLLRSGSVAVGSRGAFFGKRNTVYATIGVSENVEEKLSDDGDTSNRYERK